MSRQIYYVVGSSGYHSGHRSGPFRTRKQAEEFVVNMAKGCTSPDANFQITSHDVHEETYEEEYVD